MHRLNLLYFCPLTFVQLRKPLIERKRRERINHCLDQLRETVVGAFRLDVSVLKFITFLHVTDLQYCKAKDVCHTVFKPGNLRSVPLDSS